MFELDNRIKILQNGLEQGQIDEFQYAVGLKKFYDRTPKTFDTRSLRYMETKIGEAGLPLTDGRQGESDGMLSQIVSGFIEGFTTFGFADDPDTASERIANNVSHLLGLAPGVAAQAIGGAGAATAVISRGLKEQAKKKGSARLAKAANTLEKSSKSMGSLDFKIKQRLDTFARVSRLKGSPVGFDPQTGKKLYGLQSFPGMAASFVQKQATQGLRNNNIRVAEFMHKSILGNRFMDAATRDNIVNQSLHMGLLLAASAQPLGTRGEGFKGMALAGVHGVVAGGIFGGIGEYANIGRLLGSSNSTIRKSGETVVRSFAKALGTQPNRIDQYNTINFLMRGGAGATYGTVTSKLNDLPLEDQIYETLLSVFFSVNSRAAFENRASRDIHKTSNVIPRDYNMKEARKWLTEQPWYQNETPEYQAYWSRYLKNIQTQQIDYTLNQYNDIIVSFGETYKDLKEKGIITPEMEQQAKTDRKVQQQNLNEMYDALDAQRKDNKVHITNKIVDQKIDTERVIDSIENKKFRFDSIDLGEARKIEYAVEEVDPLSEHIPKQKSLKSIYMRIKKENTYEDIGVQDIHNMFKKVIDDTNYDINKFVEEINRKLVKTSVTPKEKRALIQAAHSLKHIDRFPIARIYIVGEKQSVKKDRDMEPILEKEAPELDIYDKPIGGLKAGNDKHGSSRVNKMNNQDVDKDGTIHYDIDYVTKRVVERYWDSVSESYKNDRVRLRNVSPLSIDVFQYIPEAEFKKVKGKKNRVRIKPIEIAENVTKKQLDSLSKQLDKDHSFIYAANGETGRIQIRTYPWSQNKKDVNHIPIKELKQINQALIDAGIPVKKGKYKSNVATYLIRLQETGISPIKLVRTTDYYIKTIKEWIKTEPYESVTKFQKRTKHMSGVEVPFDPALFEKTLNLKKLNRISSEKWNPEFNTEIQMPLDVKTIESFINDRTYSDIDYSIPFENTYIVIRGNRASKSNQDKYDQFAKDNPDITDAIIDHNAYVLKNMGSSYKNQLAFEKLSFTQRAKIKDRVGFNEMQMYFDTSLGSAYSQARFRHLVINDLPSSVINMGKTIAESNSGTDGASISRRDVFAVKRDGYGYDKETGVLKTLGVYRPDSVKKRGRIIQKTAEFEADNIFDTFMRENNYHQIDYASSIKESTGIKPADLVFNEKTGKLEVKNDKEATYESEIVDHYLNMNIYENFNKIGGQKLLQQVMSNLNTFEIDPNTEVGKKFWDRWEKYVNENAAGDIKATSIAQKEFNQGKPISGKIDDISIRLIDNIFYNKPDSEAARSLLRQIFEIERNSDFDKELNQEWTDYRQNIYNRQLVEDMLIDTNFDPGTYLRPGVLEYVEGRMQSYVHKRLTRPRIKHSYSSKLGLYDLLISGRKQKYSKASKGLANDEFMMNEGARDLIPITVYSGTNRSKTMKIGELFDSWVRMKENPTSREAVKDFAEYDRVISSVAYVRSPMISNGGFRIGRLVGFAKGRKGISLITNEYNDFMMSGADKDIDSAHMFWDLPKELIDGYKQKQIQDQLVRKDKKGKVYVVDLKDKVIGKLLANAEPAETKSRNKHLADILDTDAKIKNGKIATMSQDSIGLITNGVNQIALELDINSQLEANTKRMGINKKFEYQNAFNKIVIDRSVLLNSYIDAADLANIDLPIVALRKLRSKYEGMYEGAETGELEARRTAIRNMHKLIFSTTKKTDMPLDLQETVINYLDKTDGAKSYLGLLAKQYVGLNLKINPWSVIDKEASLSFIKDLSIEIQKHPIYKKVGIKDFKKHFMEGLDSKEFDNIIDYDTFLWNKFNAVVDLSTALTRSQSFKDYATKELKMSNESVNDFISSIVEITFEQRNRIYQSFDNNRDFFKKQNTRSYGDQIAVTKQVLKNELEALSNRRKTELEPLPEEAYRQVEDMFDSFYIATPVVKKDFVGFRGDTRFKMLNSLNNKIKRLQKDKARALKLGQAFPTKAYSDLQQAYKIRGKMQDEFLGNLPDREQTWAIRARNKKWMSNARIETMKLANKNRSERIKEVKDMLDLDRFVEDSMYDIAPPPEGQQSKIDSVVVRTKEMAQDKFPLIDLDVLTDPVKLDNLLARVKPLTTNQTDTMRKNLTDFSDIIKQATVAGNQKMLYNLASEYAFFMKKVNRTTDFIQEIDGVRLGFFVKALKNTYSKQNVLDKIKRNKELIKEAEDTLYSDITKDIPLMTYDEFYLKNKGNPNTTPKLYRDYVRSWATKNGKIIDKLADDTAGMFLKDSDTRVYTIDMSNKEILSFKNRETFDTANKGLNKNNFKELQRESLADIITDEINFRNPLQAHMRDPSKLDQILGIYQRLDKELAPFEQKLQFDRVIKFNKKTGKMEEYGITVPTSTLKTIAEQVYRLHTNANQLSDLNQKLIGYAKEFLAQDQKGYKKHSDALWELAAVKHSLGPDMLGPKKEQTTVEERADLLARLEKAEEKVQAIKQEFYIVKKNGEKEFKTPEEYSQEIIDRFLQPIFESANNSYIKSNWNSISNWFDNQTLFRKEYAPKTSYLDTHTKYWQQRLGEMFLNKHGIIEVRRLLWFDKTVSLSQDKQSGPDIQRNHFHLDDVAWVKFQLNLRDHIIDKYSDFVTPGGSLNWPLMEKSYLMVNKKKSKFSVAQNARRDIAKQQGKYGEWKAEVGKFVTEEGVSDRFYPGMGQMDDAKNREYVEKTWLPQEKKRIMSKSHRDQLVDSQLKQDVKDRLISLTEAKEQEYQRLENKVLGTNKFENPYVDKDAMDMLHQGTSRKGKLPYPGSGMSTHARSRMERMMPGWRSDSNVPLDYLNSMSRGLMQNISALYSRIYLDKFLQQSLRNPQMKDSARQWHLTMIDYTRGYMGFPSTRVVEIHGITPKEYKLLSSWKEANYNQDWKVGKLGPVEKKLLYDMEQASIPSYSEQRQYKKTLIRKGYADKDNGKKLNALIKEQKKGVSKERSFEIDIAKQEIFDSMVVENKKKYQKWLEKTTISNLNLLIQEKNIDKVNINKTPRQWFSDESVGNVMLKIESRVNKVFGPLYTKATGKKMFKSLPDNLQLRHKALVDRAQYISDLEGRFELLSLLFSPKASITNVYGGYQNIITDTGFDPFFKAFDEKYLVKEVFIGKKYNLFDETTGTFKPQFLKNMKDVHMMIDSLGLLEGNLLQELTYLQAAEPTNARKFLSELTKKVIAHTRAEKLYGNSKEVNEKIDTYTKKTVTQLASKYNVDKKVMDIGSVFMSTSEKHLRRKAFIAHYLKARELYKDLEGNIEVTDDFLVDSARKGVEGSQFIYHATYRPNFSNTAFGRVMTRFQPYAWNSIRRRKTAFEDMMAVEGHPQFEATRRFERQIANDMMTMSLATLFHFSIFEYALSPPMSWMKETSELLFGDEETRKRAFYNQYPIEAMAPLMIITPPASRFILPHVNGLINGDYDAFWKYTAWTYMPFGRAMRDAYKTINNPEWFWEYQTGLPKHQLDWHLRKVKRQAEDRFPNEDPTT
jgi:hypothetical protein